MLRDKVDENPIDFVSVPKSGPTNEDLAIYIEQLKSSKNPVIIVGGSVWSKEAALNLEKVSELTNIPIYTSHRRQSFFNNLHKNYAGDLGLGVNPEVIKNIKNSDFITLLGNRLSENPSQAFTLLKIPENKKFLKKDPKEETPKDKILNLTEELEKLAALKEKGLLTEEEFINAKAKLLN